MRISFAQTTAVAVPKAANNNESDAVTLTRRIKLDRVIASTLDDGLRNGNCGLYRHDFEVHAISALSKCLSDYWERRPVTFLKNWTSAEFEAAVQYFGWDQNRKKLESKRRYA